MYSQKKDNLLSTDKDSHLSNYGYTPKEWTAAKREAKDILIARAKVRGMMPYSEVAAKIKSVRFEAHDQGLFHLLGELSKEEDASGKGMLSAIVVHKTGDMAPGTGFFELAKQLGRDTSDKTTCWVEEIKKVYAGWSS